ncbi:MAG: TlpA family protein disulfide reductase [Parasphingopyxis sp.]|nr:TlpA family protein disulfide reductase [Sphingomonadales bacterium]
MRLGIALLLAILCLGACDRQSGDGGQADRAGSGDLGGSELVGRVDVSARGTLAPDLEFANPAGETVRLADLEGTPLLVNLWATWCAPCIAEMPLLDALAEDREGNLRVLTVSEDFQGAEVVEPFFAEQGYRRIEPWLDPENTMMATLGLDSLPVTILYDESGRELFRVHGGMDWSGARAERLIDGALGN